MYIMNRLIVFVDKGLIQVEGDQVKLSRQGRFLGNVVFRDFLFER